MAKHEDVSAEEHRRRKLNAKWGRKVKAKEEAEPPPKLDKPKKGK